MSCFPSAEEKESMAASAVIDKGINEEREILNQIQVVKILMMGPPNSGKSTMIKQFKIYANEKETERKRPKGDPRSTINETVGVDDLFQTEATPEETANNSIPGINPTKSTNSIEDFRILINKNIVEICKQIVHGAKKTSTPWSKKAIQENADFIESFDLQTIGQYLNNDIKSHISELMKDNSIKNIMKKSNEFEMMDSSFYWFGEEYLRVFQERYHPTVKDILYVRQPTVTVTETVFTVSSRKKLAIIDVGCVKTSKNKWLNIFESVHCIIFTVAANSYYQKNKDQSTTILEESVNLFQAVVTNKILENTVIFFFLNKMDLLVKLLTYHPLSEVFPDFKGGDYTEAATFMMKKFLRLSPNKDRKIFSHFTNATDIKQFRKIIKDLVIASFEALAKRTNKAH